MVSNLWRSLRRVSSRCPLYSVCLCALTISGCNIGLAAKIGVAAKTVIPRSENKNSQIAHVVKRASNKISNQLIFLHGTSMMNYFHVASWYCWLTTWHFTSFCHWKWTKTTTQIIRATGWITFYSELLSCGQMILLIDYMVLYYFLSLKMDQNDSIDFQWNWRVKPKKFNIYPVSS